MGTDNAKLSEVKVEATAGFLKGQFTWIADESQQKAAWELYVELATRITSVELKPSEGSLREALSSLYSLFGTTREILRKYGPSIARLPKGATISVAHLAVAYLNGVLRPLLAEWHPLLLQWEEGREPGVDRIQHERKWVHNHELRAAIDGIRSSTSDYVKLLAEGASVPNFAYEALAVSPKVK